MCCDLEIKNTNIYGRGVFAKKDIKNGEILEKAPIMFLPKGQWQDLEKTVVYDYCFYWGNDYAIALGIGSLFNHSYSPNAIYRANFEENTMEFISIKEIKKGEEVTVNYNGSPNDITPLWFEVEE